MAACATRSLQLLGLFAVLMFAQTRQPHVLNFFPVPVSDECHSNDGRRSGICLNTYECRIQSGESRGPCALGFGVCCVFTTKCDKEINNNITYILNDNFPDTDSLASECKIKVKLIDPSIAQLRLDFIHFSLAQPNRRTGVCDTDWFRISGGAGRDVTICGHNSGQHIFYDVTHENENIEIILNMSRENLHRVYEIKVTQLGFHQKAPTDCLQYHTGKIGNIQTMNFAVNGRHLADQDYAICIRQEREMCSIAYEPCDENSFKIGPPLRQGDSGSGDGNDLILAEARECDDRIELPCDIDEFFLPPFEGRGQLTGMCQLMHCGNSFCPDGEVSCRIESSTTPFKIEVHFGPGIREESPDDNLGMCLKYEQLPCVE